MAGKRQLPVRNQRMDLYRGIAIYGVIAIHVLFPGLFGEGVRAIARYAVPFFFLTAGYFNFNAPSKALLRRAGRVLRQLLLASVVYLLFGCILSARRGEDVWGWVISFRNMDYLMEFLQYHTVPFPYAWQLWFLGAMLMVYLLWWAVTTLSEAAGRLVPYDLLAVAAAVLLGIHLLLGEGSVLLGKQLDNRVLRNAFLDGLPFFALGGWAAWRRRDIKKAPIPWHWLAVAGGVLSIVESRVFGRQELYLGTLLLLAGLMGRCIRYRRVSQDGLSGAIQFCGNELTLPIFVIHMLVVGVIREFPALDALERLEWILPVVVAAVSTVIALGLSWGKARLTGRMGQ